MMVRKKLPILLALLCGILISAASEHVVYPAGGGNCPTPPCLTLNDYTSHNSTNHSSFLFLPGQHYLNNTLLLNNLENVTLRATEAGAIITVSPEGGVICFNTNNFTLNGLKIRYHEMRQRSVFYLFNSNWLSILNTHFFGGTSAGCFANCSSSSSRNAIGVVYSTISLRDVTFTRSCACNGGAVNSQDSNLTLSGHVLFSANTALRGGAVYATYSRINFQESIHFLNNSAISIDKNRAGYGGAMYLFESHLELLAPVEVVFHNNTASELGGALYVDDQVYDYLCKGNLPRNTIIIICFFEVKSEHNSFQDVHLEFTGNSAAGGSVLHGGALEYCKLQVNSVPQINGLQFLENITTIYNNNSKPRITSNPYKIFLCTDDDEIDYSLSSNFNTIPGRKFNVSLIAVGQENAAIPARIETQIQHFENNEKVIVVSNSFIPSRCTNVTFQATSDGGNVDFNVFPHDCNAYDKTLSIRVDLGPCPNGFSLNNSKCSCSASLSNHILEVECDVQTGLISHAGSYWIQPILNITYQGFRWCTHCPNGYCNKTHPILLNFSSNEHDSLQCADNRNGTLCGACSEGYSLTLSNFECRSCEDRFLSLMVLFVVAGVALIALLLALHMTVAAGTLNGLILYANIVNVHRDILFTYRQPGFRINPLSVFISWLNLDFGIPTCFYDGLDDYQYSWLQFTFPLYLWFLIGAIILSSKHSRRVGRLLGSNPVAVLATLILMSYTKLLQTAVAILIYADLENSISSGMQRVWKFDGNIIYFKEKHFILAITAVCVITFLLLPYVLLLTFGYRLQAYSNRRGFRWFNKLTPLLDAYYAPYNKNTRYWTGLMLMVRIGLFISYVVIGSSNLAVVACVFIAISAYSWLAGPVYTKQYLDVLEVSFVLNIGILSITSSHVSQTVVTSLSAGVALVEFTGIVLFHTILRLKDTRCFKDLISRLQHARQLQVEMRRRKSLDTREDEDHKTLCVTHSNIELRESLLESIQMHN